MVALFFSGPGCDATVTRRVLSLTWMNGRYECRPALWHDGTPGQWQTREVEIALSPLLVFAMQIPEGQNILYANNT